MLTNCRQFLIQSDFIAQASREDVFDNTWNIRLLNEVSNAFVQSIDSFLRHPSLKYHWVRFIPTNRIADDFWGRLQTQIIQAVSSRKAFYSEQDLRLLAPHQLRIVPTEYTDSCGEPLLADLRQEENAYISKGYNAIDVHILRKMHASTLSMQEFLNRAQQDISHSDSGNISRIQSNPPLGDDWQDQMAQQFKAALKTGSRESDFLRKLSIVPLNNGRWVPPYNASIFLPTTGGVEIPVDLPLSLVDALAIQNHSRKELFRLLGIHECPPAKVFPLIEQQYGSGSMTVPNNVAHIKFMFWHNKELPSKKLQIWLPSNTPKIWYKPSEERHGWAYCPVTKGKYTASSLLQSTVPTQLSSKLWFVRKAYLHTLQKCQPRNGQTGVAWFRSYFDVKEYIQLQSRSLQRATSCEFDYIIEERAESLLGVIDANRFQYLEEKDWEDRIRKSCVPILCSMRRMPLETTYLPLPSLRATVRSLSLEQDFGFLQELQDIEEVSAFKWTFLKRLGVVMEENVEFWIRLLTLARTKPNIESEHVFRIYQNLQKFTGLEETRRIKSVALVPTLKTRS